MRLFRGLSGLSALVLSRNQSCSVLLSVCAANRRASLAGAKPVRQEVAPAGSNRSGDGSNDIAEAFDGKDRNSDSANRQAVTRVNVEQASKKTMRKPTGHVDREG